MKLFTRGPAFGLPSIDADCIAAIALFRLYAIDEWELIPTHDDSSRLPLLIDGKQRLSGFTAIARHLSSLSTDEIAYSRKSVESVTAISFLEANAQLLLDVSLYVSSENYRLATRPAFTKILPWYANYITPPRLRQAARARTEYLDISNIDVDDVHGDLSDKPAELGGGVGKQEGFEAETQKRASLLLPRKETVRSLLGRPQHAAVFKLHALAETFFQPLQQMLGDKQFLVDGDHATEVDCLAYGYLSLMLYPKLPQDWLAASLRRSYPRLVEYVGRLDTIFDLRTKVSDVVALSKCSTSSKVHAYRVSHEMQLPWQNSPARPLLHTLRWTFTSLVEYFFPFGATARLVNLHERRPGFLERYGLTLLGCIVASAGLGIHWAFRTGTLTWPKGENIQVFGRKRVLDFDHLGAALAGISVLGTEARRDAAYHRQEEASAVPVGVEVEVVSR